MHHRRTAALALLLCVLVPRGSRALTRCEAITRAQSWVDAAVPYSQNSWFANAFGSYRQDCSGYVSMAWALPTSMVTWTLPQVSTQLGSFDDLQPGDAVNRTSSHVMLFKEWVQPGVSYKAYEERDYGQVAGIFTWTVAYAKANGYAPYRLNGIAECCTPHCDGSKIVGADCGVGDCAVYGATCVDDALGVRCVSVFCPPTGTKKVCVSDKLVGDCKDGAITTGDCSAYGAICSTAGTSEARCVSVFCVGSASEVPVEKETCMHDGKLAHCDANGGLSDAKSCPAGQSCVKQGGSAACVAPESPAAPTPDPGTPPSGLELGLASPHAPGAGEPATPPLAPTAPDPGDEAELVGGCAVAGSGERPPLVLLALLGLALRRRLRAR